MPGTWIRERGTLETDADDMGEFDFRLAGPEGQLLIGKVYDESRIFLVSEEDGIMEIEAEDLAARDRAIVEAVFIPGDEFEPEPKQEPKDCEVSLPEEECLEVPEVLDGTLRIAIMLVSMGEDNGGGEPPVDAETASGNLVSVDKVTGELFIEQTLGIRCVNTDEDTTFIEVENTEQDPDFFISSIDELEVGAFVTAIGDTGECIDANVVTFIPPEEF